MRKAYLRITNHLIKEALQFPVEWEIEKIAPDTPGVSVMLISGPDFPKVNKDGEIKDVQLIIHKEEIRFEVNEI